MAGQCGRDLEEQGFKEVSGDISAVFSALLLRAGDLVYTEADKKEE